MRVLSKIFLFLSLSIISYFNLFGNACEVDKVGEFLNQSLEYAGPFCSFDFSTNQFNVYDFSPEIKKFISEEDLRQTINEFQNLIKAQLIFNNINLDEIIPARRSQDYYSYVQRLMVKPEDKVITVGDIHGSCHSLCRNILTWIDRGFLDRDFRLAPNTYLVFLGDIADRGRYGVECWYFLMKLKIKNPERVFILRGNHEDYGISIINGFYYELARKYEQSSLDFIYGLPGESYLIPKFDNLYVNPFDANDLDLEFNKIFYLLPQALFVGNQADGFIQFCHGGVPISFVQKIFRVKCMYIPKCDIDSIGDAGPIDDLELNYKLSYGEELVRLEIDQRDVNFLILKRDLQDLLYRDENELLSFKQIVRMNDFCWGDFDSDDAIKYGSRSFDEGFSFKVGAGIALNIMQEIYGLNIRSIFRGHQHNIHSIGYYDINGFLDYYCGFISMINKPVYTFMSCPEGVGTDYDSFGILYIKDSFENWRLEFNIRNLVFLELRNAMFVHVTKGSGSLEFVYSDRSQLPDEMMKVLEIS